MKTEATSYVQVDSISLERYTAEGWKFVRVLEADVVAYGKEETGPAPDAYSKAPTLAKPFVVREHRFLLKRASDDPSAKAEAALAKEAEARYCAECTVEEAKKVEAKALKEVEELTERNTRLKGNNNMLRADKEKFERKTWAMEEDIGKLRKQFGDKAFNEAVGRE